MKSAELKKLSGKEIFHKIIELRNDLLGLRMRKQVGQVEKPHKLKAIRRDIARLETTKRSQEIAEAQQG